MGPPKATGIKNSNSEQQDEEQRQDQTRKELTLVAQKAEQFYEKYFKNYKYVPIEMCLFTKDKQCFLMVFLSLPLLIPKIMQTQ